MMLGLKGLGTFELFHPSESGLSRKSSYPDGFGICTTKLVRKNETAKKRYRGRKHK